MRKFILVEFVSNVCSGDAIARTLKDFARTSPEWRFLEAESDEYEKSLKQPALLVEQIAKGMHDGIALAIAERHDRPGTLRLFNIFPRCGELSGRYPVGAQAKECADKRCESA